MNDDARLLAYVLRKVHVRSLLRLDEPAHQWVEALRKWVDARVETYVPLYQCTSAAATISGVGLGMSGVLRCAPDFVRAMHTVPGPNDTLTEFEAYFFVHRTASRTSVRAYADEPPSIGAPDTLSLSLSPLGSVLEWE